MDDELCALDLDTPPPPPRDCERCNRPTQVCLCEWLPQQRLKLSGRLFVLQHPFEKKRRLATVPIASAALENFELLTGRSFGPGKSEALTQLVQDAIDGMCRLYVLFPGPGAIPLSEALERMQTGEEGSQSQVTDYGLIVIDGTWKEAKEMFKASSSWWLPPHGPGIRIEVAKHVSASQEGALRMEPWEGCMSTVEAIAGALELLEPHGSDIYEALTVPLYKMVETQSKHNRALEARRKGETPIVVDTKRRLGTRGLPKSEDCSQVFNLGSDKLQKNLE